MSWAGTTRCARVLGGSAGADAHAAAAAAAQRPAVGPAALAAPTASTPAELYRLTGGNPFFVSEVLAAPGRRVPPTVVDAVLARVRRARAATPRRRSSGSPSSRPASSAACSATWSATSPRSPRRSGPGCSRCADGVVAFRHELARRAVVQSLPASVRLRAATHGAARAARPRRTATRSGSCTTRWRPATTSAVVAHGPGRRPGGRPARRAPAGGGLLRAGAGPRRRCWRPAERAALGEAYAWALSNSNQLHAAAAAAARPSRELGGRSATTAQPGARAGHPVPAAVADRTHRRRRGPSAERALQLADADRATASEHALAALNLGRPARADRPGGGGAAATWTRRSTWPSASGPRTWPRCATTTAGPPALQLGDRGGRGRAAAQHRARAGSIDNHEYVMRGYYNLVEGLWRLGRLRRGRALHRPGRGLRPRPGLPRAQRTCSTPAGSGCWRMRGAVGARRRPGCAELLDGRGRPGDDRPRDGADPGPAAGAAGRSGRRARLLALAARARRAGADVLEWLVPDRPRRCIEHAWLTGARAAGAYPRAAAGADRPAGHARCGAASCCGTCAGSGRPVDAVRRLPRGVRRGPARRLARPPHASGSGRRPVRAGARAGRVRRGRARPSRRSRMLDALGARPGRRAGPASAARARGHPAAPPARAEHPREPGRADRPPGRDPAAGRRPGCPTPRSPSRLVVSTRTVDHHVSAILRKLDAGSRREATARIASLNLP